MAGGRKNLRLVEPDRQQAQRLPGQPRELDLGVKRPRRQPAPAGRLVLRELAHPGVELVVGDLARTAPDGSRRPGEAGRQHGAEYTGGEQDVRGQVRPAQPARDRLENEVGRCRPERGVPAGRPAECEAERRPGEQHDDLSRPPGAAGDYDPGRDRDRHPGGEEYLDRRHTSGPVRPPRFTRPQPLP